MKKLFLVLSLVLAFGLGSSVFAELEVIDGPIKADSLGIGTIPVSGSELHIKGDQHILLEGLSVTDRAKILYEPSGVSRGIKLILGNLLDSYYFKDLNANTLMAITSTGVGIATDTPAYKLDIAGALNLNKGIASDIALRVNGAEALWYNGSYFSWGFGGTYNYFGDKIAINTTSPDANAMLDINGRIRIRGGTPLNGYVLTSDANGLANWQIPTSSGIGGSGTANYLSKFISPTTLGNSMIFENSYGIGINTAPVAKLDIVASGENDFPLIIRAKKAAAAGFYRLEGGQAGPFTFFDNGINGTSSVGFSFADGGGTTLKLGPSGTNSYIYTNLGINKIPSSGVALDVNGQAVINGQVKITGGSPANGEVLTSDANGLATWESPTLDSVVQFYSNNCPESPTGYYCSVILDSGYVPLYVRGKGNTGEAPWGSSYSKSGGASVYSNVCGIINCAGNPQTGVTCTNASCPTSWFPIPRGSSWIEVWALNVGTGFLAQPSSTIPPEESMKAQLDIVPGTYIDKNPQISPE